MSSRMAPPNQEAWGSAPARRACPRGRRHTRRVTEAIATAHDPSLTVYGAAWCPHCKRVKKFLAGHRIGYTNVDVDADPQAIERLKQLQAGGQGIVARVHLMGPVRVDHRRDDLPASA